MKECKKQGIEKMKSYAEKHGIHVDINSYAVYKKHRKNTMKNITEHSRIRRWCSREEYCEVMRATVYCRGKEIQGSLIAYKNGIRFDANERY
ncbi:MAG: hypothetical protein IKC10_06745 [Alphaproteobacteria bacterium]|nr:hypothetical protein [Alphaproteobacteria bacterium]